MSGDSKLIPSPGFQPNFFASYSVTLDRPISEVFRVLGTKEGHERVCRLSALCTKFSLLEEDKIVIPANVSLGDVCLRSLPSASNRGDDPQQEGADVKVLSRQYFAMQETVPILFGMMKQVVDVSGSMTWDENDKIALYEVNAGMGVKVWKLRKFEVVDLGVGGIERTKIIEEVKGHAPFLLKGMIQRETTETHTAHMNAYHTLFE